MTEVKKGFWGNLFSKSERPAQEKQNPQSRFEGIGNYLFTVGYNGEKNLGEIGPVKNYRPEYELLRIRSWQSYYESEVTQTVLNKYRTWVIGKGLKMQSEPVKEVLKSEKISIDFQAFSVAVESRFNMFKKSRHSDYAGMRSVDMQAFIAFTNAIIGGDVLVVLRYIDKCVKIQLIDASHVKSPVYGTELFPEILKNGNRVVNGVEYSPTGETVAFYVRVDPIVAPYKYERIPAKGAKSGLTMAWMVFGSEFRLDNKRGVPLVATVLETLKKLERYKEAMVGSAEETAKIAYQIVHEVFSTGENPLSAQMAKAAYNYGGIGDQLPIDVSGNDLANTVAATTNKQAYNMPRGSEIKTIESKNQLYFKDFYETNFNIICSALEIPPEIAASKYDSNFSASRAALKDWENTLNVKRNKFAVEFYQPIYEFWLETEILNNTIQAEGYLTAKSKGNFMVLEAYRNARFIGAQVPHIDPLKEVNAVRAKLGDAAVNMPLITLEEATESLNGGESTSNIQRFAEELQECIGLKISIDPTIMPVDTTKKKKEDASN